MTAALARLKTHFANWREWELNPIVIKELRQGVRSLTVAGMLILFLVVLFVASLLFLITQSFDVNANMEMGASMFQTFTGILAFASILFIPLYTGVRVAAERQENNPDLLYVTTLTPARIIRGKFLCSSYIALLFFSACMPFMAFSNLLRGVDLPTVFFILAFLYLIVCVANMIAIFFACLPVSRPFKFLFIIGGMVGAPVLIGSLVGMSFYLMRSGVGAMMGQRVFWIGTLTAAAVGIALTGLFFVLSVALISPLSANRALAARIYLTIFWLLGGLLAVRWVVQTGDAGRMLIWATPTFFVMVLALLVVISNSDQLSLRVRRKIPRSPLLRFFAFFFFNGAAGGLLWAGGIFIATYYVTKAVMDWYPATAVFTGDDRYWFATTSAYAFAYALTALLIHRKFLPQRPPKITGLLAILLAGGWAIAPTIILFFANQLSWKSVEGLQLGNVFNVFFSRDPNEMVYHQYFAFGWLFIVIVLNARWFLRQARNFKPPNVENTSAIAEVQ